MTRESIGGAFESRGQLFIRGDDFKLLADYEDFREQAVQVKNNRAVIQMQVRW